MKTLIVALAVAGAVSAVPVSAQTAPAEAPRAPSCLRLDQVKGSEVIDKQHIVFRMRDGRSYLSTLPRGCPGLRRDTAWLFKGSSNEICDLDMITVLNPLGGGFMPGAACGLGKFAEVAPAELDVLRAAARAAREGPKP